MIKELLRALLALIIVAIVIFAVLWLFTSLVAPIPDVIEKLVWFAYAVYVLIVVLPIIKA